MYLCDIVCLKYVLNVSDISHKCQFCQQGEKAKTPQELLSFMGVPIQCNSVYIYVDKFPEIENSSLIDVAGTLIADMEN